MKINDGYTLNLSVWTDNLLNQAVKSGEGTQDAESYFFRYDGDDFVDGRLTIPATAFADGPVKITFILNAPEHYAQTQSQSFKFSWIHARRAGDKNDYVGRGQRFDMESWSDNCVSFYLSNKMQYKSPGGWKTHDSVVLALDVWVKHTYESQLTNKKATAKINCDPQIEIQPL